MPRGDLTAAHGAIRGGGISAIGLRSNFDRHNIFDVPSYKQMIDIAKEIPDDDEAKIPILILVATGCRVSELLRVKKSHIKFFNSSNIELQGNFKFEDVDMVQFNMFTEKNRNTKYRIVPLIMNDLFSDLIKNIYIQWKTLDFQESFLVHVSRQCVWRGIKIHFGKDYYPHFLRHASVTNDTRAGINPAILKSKYGWSDLRPHSIYSHLNYTDLMEAQRRVFGVAKAAKQVIPDVNTPQPYNKRTTAGLTEIAQQRDLQKRGLQQQFKNREKTRRITEEDIALV
jgi:hypothetical protein